ncbi:MAG TPA: hypothetical protein PKI15_04615 [Candidatus Cloacimonadota bacterium]|nr:hypothetical protein [Candidatus Cloacimonadota bacterium]
MSSTRELLSGGMANALPPDLLPAGTAALIQNMRIDADGTWRAIPAPELMQEGLDTPLGSNTWDWQPANLPDGCIESVVYITFDGDGNVLMTYKKSSGYYTTDPLQTDVNILKLQVSKDAQQFLFIDGRDGMAAQRIVIDADGVISCRRFGTQQPITAPIIRQIDCSKYEDQQYTGMPMGSILFYAYCIVNEYGERSNPSPTIVCDTSQWFAKGSVLMDVYEYSDINRGSIKKVTLECAIPVPAESKRIEIYRTSAEYHESNVPMEGMKLVLSQDISSTDTSVSVTDSSFYSPVAIDYENDSAPAGDDLVLDMGTVFIANAVSDRTFAAPVEKVWAIRLNNKNSLNYVNRWITIDIRDDVAHALPGLSSLDYFAGLSSANLLSAPSTKSLRFVDSDMITPITAYCHGNAQYATIYPLQEALHTTKAWKLVHLQIPYLQANTEKTIYLVQFTELVSYGADATVIGTEAASRLFHDEILDNPVRDENCLITVGRMRNTPPVVGGNQAPGVNKANRYWEKTLYDCQEILTGSMPIIIDDEVINILISSEENTHGFLRPTINGTLASAEYERDDGIPAKESGYFYAFCMTSTYGVYRIADIDTHEGTDGTITLEITRAAGDNNWLRAIVTTVEAGDNEPVSLHLPNIGSGESKFFVFVSWRKAISNGTPVEQITEITLAAISHYASTRSMSIMADQPVGALPEPLNPSLTLYGTTYVTPIFGMGYYYLNMGEYINEQTEIIALSKFLTHFPTEPIGYRKTFIQVPAISGQYYCVNQNVSIETISVRNETRPGKVRWSNGAAVPKLFERNITDEIIRIMPVKSFMPTDEHNTILVWTARGDLLRIALTGDNESSTAPITEMVGTVLQNRHAVLQVGDGIVWCDDNGIHLLSSAGRKSLSQRRITMAEFTVIYNSRDNEILFVKSTGETMVYSLNWDTWSSVIYPIVPEGFVEFAGKWCVTNDDGIYEMLPTNKSTTMTPLIRTRKIPARRKINRITLHSSDATLKAIIANHRVPGGTISTPTYALTGDVPCGIPGLSGDYVQFEIETDSIISFDIEVKE